MKSNNPFSGLFKSRDESPESEKATPEKTTPETKSPAGKSSAATSEGPPNIIISAEEKERLSQQREKLSRHLQDVEEAQKYSPY